MPDVTPLRYVYDTGNTVGLSELQAGETIAATSISNTPAGNIAATTVQAAINELDTEKAGLALANTFTQPQTVTANSTSTALTVTQTGTGNAFVVEDSASTDATPFVIDAAGQVLVGTAIAPSQETNLRLYHNTARNLELSSSLTDAVAKAGRISVSHYTNAEEAFSIIGGASDGTNNIVQIGGVSGTLNAATIVNFYTAANTTTLTGSIKATLNAAGDFYLITPALLGYSVGAGGAVTQITSRTTGVTLSKPTGAITLVSAAGSATAASFTVTNTLVEANSRIIVNQVSGTDLYEIHITAVASGSFRITFKTTGGTTTEQPVFSFTVLKGANS